ncbi:glycosyltransferase [Candidatus Sumerlaeota bacterium]|nr:glycosyltransferase [Candidatus Sumerlaeota bacterium]
MTCETETLSGRSPGVRPVEPVDLAALNFFPAFAPPRSGGEMRYWHLYTRLSRLGFRVRMVGPTHPFVEPETIEHTPRCTEWRIPKTTIHHRLHQAMGRLLGQAECSAAVVAMALGRHKAFLTRAREVLAASRVVVFDYPLPLGPLKGAMRRNRPLLVYNSYNVESLLARRALPGLAGRAIARWIARHEEDLCRRADVVFACSHDDADRMTALYNLDPSKIYIVPNGVDVREIAAMDPGDEGGAREARASLGLDRARPMALFLGSQHPPNIEAARFLIERVAPRAASVQFVVAGSVCGALGDAGAENLRVYGPFDDAEKTRLFRAATVAVNPIFSGSGTNLKMLEFFASALPVVATPMGARGLAVEDGRHVSLADPESFADRVVDLVENPTRREEMGRAARDLAETRYDWARISEDAAEILHHKTHRRVLVLSEYPVTPASFGGKVRMRHLYGALGRETNVTVLTQTPDAQCRRLAIAPGVEEINIPENGLKRIAKKAAAAFLGVAADDLVARLTVRFDRSFRRAFRRESRFAGCVVLSQPFLVPLVRGLSDVPVVYESHDVAALLKKELYGNGFLARRALAAVRRCEREAIRRARVVAACSEEDRRRFRELYADVCPPERLVVVPNGVDYSRHFVYSLDEKRGLRRRSGLPNAAAMAAFLGSGHPPNVEAARFIIDSLAPRLPDMLFLLVGGVCWPLQFEPRSSNVVLMFEQDEIVKNRLLAISDIALNPLTSGSGTSLKMLDCMAAGAAVVATDKGARGVAIESGVNGVVCATDAMADEIACLVADPALCAEIGSRGRDLARELYDWSVVSAGFVSAILREMT